jgi:hypothetical protein
LTTEFDLTSRTVTAIKVVPSASRLVRSLRDLGYEFPQAVADVVDNSIAAGATRVAIDVRFDGPSSWLRIADNGSGMDGAQITEAMRYGSNQSYEEESLGKFGLGLKTASLSQCRTLSIASRRDPDRARIEARQLDLDHVLKADRWEIFALDAHASDERLAEPLQKGTGTVVLWEGMDRVLAYKIPSGRRARSAVDALAEQLDQHLGMIYHRFLAGEVEGRRRLRILVNGRAVAPWDPFARDEPATIVLPGCDVDLPSDDGIGLVRFQPYVLPSRERFSNDNAFHSLAGPRKWNAQQGFYIYRANRMIQSGGWCRMRALDEHVKLARASIDFFPDLDGAFEINVAKVRATLPAELRERLVVHVDTLIRSAQAAYRENPAERSTIASRRATVRGIAGAATALERSARSVGELRGFRRIVRHLRSTDHALARALGF